MANGGYGVANNYNDGGSTASIDRWYGGGGGGGNQSSPVPAGGYRPGASPLTGWGNGSGGAGTGSRYGTKGYGSAPNTGGGGGDQPETSVSGYPVWSGNGGSGIVVIRYLSTSGVAASGGDSTNIYDAE